MASEAAKVAQKCEEAKGSRSLDLSDCDLRKFPDAVYFLMKGIELESVTLMRNHLRTIPAKFGTRFLTITSLDVSWNQLVSLPTELANLSELKSLNASHNCLTSLPESLEALLNLQDIDISYNKIAIPFQVTSSLQYLNVSNNLLPVLPIVAPSCNLKELNVRSNLISTVDVNGLSLLPWIEAVDIRDNPIHDGVNSFLKSLVRIKFIVED